MNIKSNSFSIKEQIFLLFMAFFTTVSIVTIIFNRGKVPITSSIKWIFIALFCLTLTLLAFKRIKIHIVHRLGTYTLLFIILPLFWLTNTNLFSPNIAYTLLIFMLVNYQTQKNERVLLNILGILMIQVLILFIYKKPDILSTWIISLPFVFSFLAVLLITIERAYEIERKYNKQREEQLTKLTRIDHLTGLYNRNYMEHKLKSVHSIWKRGVQTYSLIMIDIDYFKNYNDHYGHIQGDSCLKLISSVLQNEITRDTDYAFRYGGEEFLIILGFTDEIGANLVANRIKDAISEAEIPHLKSKINKNITISMGIATINDSYNSFADLLLRTDKALYSAKENGRDRIVQYKEELVTSLENV